MMDRCDDDSPDTTINAKLKAVAEEPCLIRIEAF